MDASSPPPPCRMEIYPDGPPGLPMPAGRLAVAARFHPSSIWTVRKNAAAGGEDASFRRTGNDIVKCFLARGE